MGREGGPSQTESVLNWEGWENEKPPLERTVGDSEVQLSQGAEPNF